MYKIISLPLLRTSLVSETEATLDFVQITEKSCSGDLKG